MVSRKDDEPAEVKGCIEGIVLPRVVPLGVLLLLIFQIAAGSMLIGRLETRITQLETQVSTYGDMNVRLAKMEVLVDQNMRLITTRLDSMKESLAIITSNMSKLREDKINAGR